VVIRRIRRDHNPLDLQINRPGRGQPLLPNLAEDAGTPTTTTAADVFVGRKRSEDLELLGIALLTSSRASRVPNLSVVPRRGELLFQEEPKAI
jgi:hypothetical protein